MSIKQQKPIVKTSKIKEIMTKANQTQYNQQQMQKKQLQNSFQIKKMEIDRNFSFLCSMDLKKIITNESKKQIQSSSSIDFRPSQRSTSVEVSLSNSFPFETLITNVELIWVNPTMSQTYFENVQVQVNSLSSRGLYGQLINQKIDKQPNQYIFSGAGFTYCLKVNLWLKNDAKKKNYRSSQKQFLENAQKLITESIKQINVYGVTINSNPSSILLTKLLNISQSFKKYNLFQQASETDILVALSLINARRFVLAAEILRKVSKFYVEKYNSSKSIMDLNKTERSLLRQVDEEINHITTRTNFGAGRTLEGSKFLQRAAKVQLLIAETVSHPTLVFEKLQAYHRCNCYASGNVSPVLLCPDADLEQVALSTFPQIAGFLLKVLSDKLQPFRIASLKSIQFFIETLGCSIGQSFLSILKQVINTYPSTFSPEINPNKIPYGLQQVQILPQKSSSVQTGPGSNPSIKNKILMDHYHHLLQTLLSLIGMINRKMIICAFADIIAPSISNKDSSSELKLYLLRFAQRSVSICGADLVIQVSFIGLLLSLCQQKNLTKLFANGLSVQKNQSKSRENLRKKQEGQGSGHQNKQVIHNLMHFSHKILAHLKLKVLPRYSGLKMQSFLQWINKTLSYFGENQMLTNSNSNHSLFVFTNVLDFISSSYSILKFDNCRLTHSPIETMLYFLNLAIYNQQNGLPFDKILDTFAILLKFHCKMDPNFQLDQEIISRILQKSKEHNLSLKQLQILIRVLQTTDQNQILMLQWLDTYLVCIPHSTYDETYKVFCLMLKRGIKNIESYPFKQQLLKKIIKTMLDQYSVKGKAHQEAKQTLIESLIKSSPLHVLQLIKICLLGNKQPKPENYYSKRKIRASEKTKKDNQHRFDSKSYKIDYQMFLQKISMAQMIMTSITAEKELCLSLINQSFIEQFFNCVKILVESSSLKLKNKALSLMNYFLQISRHSWKQENFKIREFTTIIRHIFSISKTLVLKLKQSKLMYSPIYNLINLCRCLEIQQQKDGISIESIQQIYEEMQEKIKSESNWSTFEIKKCKGQRMIMMIMIKQFIKIWPSLGLSLVSSWENVREIYTLLIIQMFKEGLVALPDPLKKKVLEISKSLLLSLLNSNEHNQRNAGLKIFGTMIGLRSTIENTNNSFGNMIKQNMKYLKNFTQKVFDLTFDWDEKNVQIAQNLCQICMSQQNKLNLNQRRSQKLTRKTQNMDQSYLSFNLQQELNFQKKHTSIYASNTMDKQFMKQSWLFEEQSLIPQQSYCPIITEQLLCKIVQFRNLIDKDVQTKTQVLIQKESFMEQNQEQFYDMEDEKAESVEAKEKSQDDQLQFQDLGIIQLDDEQWSEEEQKSEKAIQKLPLKKMYKLSPSVLNASKPQRIRSKRFHQNQFEFREKIIVDQIEQKIANSNNIQKPSQFQNPQKMVNPQNMSESMIKPNTNEKQKQKEKQKQSEKKQQRNERLQRNKQGQRKQRMQFNKHNLVMEPLIIDDYDVKEEDREDSYGEEYRGRDRWERELKKQVGEKQQQVSGRDRQKQREGEKKSKKASAKKRKPSSGK